jgi:hypothetical protein
MRQGPEAVMDCIAIRSHQMHEHGEITLQKDDTTWTAGDAGIGSCYWLQ